MLLRGANLRLALFYGVMLSSLVLAAPQAWSGYDFIWTSNDQGLYSSGWPLTRTCIGDIDADGALEMLMSQSNGFVVVDLLTGYREYTSPPLPGGGWGDAFLFDVDGDGYPEIVVSGGGSAGSVFGVVDFLGIAAVGAGTDIGFVPVIPSLNPFATSTVLNFSLARESVVRLSVFDLQGRRIRQLQNGKLRAGEQSISWNSVNDSGQLVPSGVYLYRVELDGKLAQTGKLVLIRD